MQLETSASTVQLSKHGAFSARTCDKSREQTSENDEKMPLGRVDVWNRLIGFFVRASTIRVKAEGPRPQGAGKNLT